MHLCDKFENSHLFYCLNAHPGETPEEFQDAVFNKAVDVWQHTGLPGEKAVGLWINNSLSKNFNSEKFAADLKQAGLYCVSLNGFPFDSFHGKVVKKEVYRPDWSDKARLEYTCRLADILATILPENETEGTISTLPITYRLCANSKLINKAVKNISLAVEYLQQLMDKTGKRIFLCIEPEPDCFLDGTVHASRWFNEELFSYNSAARDYVGICLDTVHCGVLFEHPDEALRIYTNEGIQIKKLQIGAALSCIGKNHQQLEPFAEERYLHQTRICEYGGIASYPDLPHAMEKGGEDDGEWRVHFHVPICWDGTEHLASTAEAIERNFLISAYEAGCRHFESEIYTLNVFPEELSITDVLASDLKMLNFLMGPQI